MLIVPARRPGEAGKLNEVLAKHRRSLQLHVILRKAIGAAILFPLHSHSNHLTQGAVIGGNPPAADEDDETKTLRTDIAYQIGAIAEANDKPEEIFRAFVNPTETVAIWKKDGKAQIGAFLPDGISPDDVLLKNDAKSILTLKADNFANAKLVAKPADLGSLLAIDGWAAGSEGPQEDLPVPESLEKRAARNELNTQRRIDRVVQRRLKSARTMEHAIEQAKEWDPNKGNYATVQVWVNNYGGRWRAANVNGRTHYRPHRVGGWYDNGGSRKRDTKRFTTDSRREWQIRSRNTTRYLGDALQAAKSLKSLDRQAVKLGLEPMYEVAELDNLIKELTRTQQAVAQQFAAKINKLADTAGKPDRTKCTRSGFFITGAVPPDRPCDTTVDARAAGCWPSSHHIHYTQTSLAAEVLAALRYPAHATVLP